ncbi:MAG: hypothetical protein IRY83_15765 [Chloroflexi bacterium]|jgi:quinol monooxygenase YgiN|nr:hypothetical protein [Chloroflexota bacterium]
MIVVQLQARVKSEEDALRFSQFYRNVIVLAMAQNTGFLEGRCCLSINDPCTLLVDEHWGNLGAFCWWARSDLRRALVEQVAPVLVDGFREYVFREIG